MKKIVLSTLALILGLAFATGLYAKCMTASDWKDKKGKRIVVCVKGDSASDRKAGQTLCEKIKGGPCSGPTSFSSSCANNECYDAGGKNHNSLSGY
ncbi:MAG: hypothetical protein AB1641_17910 [Thermodesulfobacteriota bacterium]